MAADKPGIPGMPRYKASSVSTMTIEWDDVSDNGGSLITAYNVYVDTGDLTDDTFNLVGSTEQLEFTLDNTVLTQYIAGSRYRFRITAVNVLGESDPSNEVRVELASLPPKPASPSIDRVRSTLTSLYVQWLSPAANTLGYRLYMSEKGQGQFNKVYDGTTNRDIRSANVTGLVTGKVYSFYVEAVNFNGVG